MNKVGQPEVPQGKSPEKIQSFEIDVVTEDPREGRIFLSMQ